VGLIVAASTITGIFLKAPAGAISDHLGRKRILLVGAAVFGTIADAGQALGPILIGGLLELAGYLPAFALLGGLLLAWTAIFALKAR